MDPAIVTLLVILGLALAVILIVAALLIQFGCFISGAVVPSFGRAFAVNLLYMVAGFIVNAGIIMAVGFTLDDWIEHEAQRSQVYWIVRGAQLISNIFVIGLVGMMCLEKVNFWRGVVIGLVLSFGMVALGFAAAFTLGSMIALQR